MKKKPSLSVTIVLPNENKSRRIPGCGYFSVTSHGQIHLKTSEHGDSLALLPSNSAIFTNW